jgi:3-phosphoshikimate 1-carboxyvinyltransferase
VSTRHCLEGLGVEIAGDGAQLAVRGVGLRGFREPKGLLFTENSGTTTRLLCGLLAGQNLFAVLNGDDSLNGRPMGRVVEPLRAMGALIQGREDGRYAPLCFLPGNGDLRPLTWELPVPSAQVKSSLMLAALRASGASTIAGMIESRDHTERMLRSLGVSIAEKNGALRVDPVTEIPGFRIEVPGDVSSAAFFIAAALISEKALTVRACGVNPTRCGFLAIARAMGAMVIVNEEGASLGEPFGTIMVEPGTLRGTRVEASQVPDLIDEIPLLAVLGLFARGRTEVRGAGELRFKESDRLAMIAELADSLGGHVDLFDDGFSIDGPQVLRPATVDPHGDHRIAMAAAVAAVGIPGGVRVKGFDCARVSYPDFIRDFARLGGKVE